ncbi:hypothetical protein WJX73_007426 [Symbiochloris irregularis]|uniref:Enhancer of rudimentary homolog n=1 Tax=Symbiochloris irregularis TaxID=706552 RepID=A0AAW1NMG8_9CHLO
MANQSHTIILEQQTLNKNSRAWRDYQSVSQAMNGVTLQFERFLKDMNPTVPHIQYNLKDLEIYIDQMPDLSALVFDPKTETYIPCNKAWIKEQVGIQLRRQAGKR